MHEGKVVHFEDDESWRGIVSRQLSDSEHELVAQAATLAEALEILEKIQSGEIDANVVITDGNLSDVSTAHDATVITDRIRELGLAVRTIGLSGSPMEDFGIEVDADLSKSGLRYGDITRVVDELPEPEVTQ